MLSVALTLIFTIPLKLLPFAGAIISIWGLIESFIMFEMFTAIDEVFLLPDGSLATALKVYWPFGKIVVFQMIK